MTNCPIKVVWQGDALAAVLTTSRLVIINANLGVIAQVKERPVNYPPISTSSLFFSSLVPPSPSSSLIKNYITSVIWLEWVLLYTTDTHLKYMTLDGKVFTLRSLDRDKLGITLSPSHSSPLLPPPLHSLLSPPPNLLTFDHSPSSTTPRQSDVLLPQLRRRARHRLLLLLLLLLLPIRLPILLILLIIPHGPHNPHKSHQLHEFCTLWSGCGWVGWSRTGTGWLYERA